MKKIMLVTVLFLGVFGSAFAASCRVNGPDGSVTVSCDCSVSDACAKAVKAYNAIQ